MLPKAPFWWDAHASPWPALLLPAALAWDMAARLRWAFAHPFHAGIPVICIGNFTSGGAGKTPAAIAIARILHKAGARPFFLTRGYGGTIRGPHRVDRHKDRARDIGDEALLLARIAPAIVAADKAAGARLAQDQGASVIVMDDGLQNPSLAKTLSLAVIDGERGLGNEHVIPAGPLRANLGFQLGKTDGFVLVGGGAAASHIEALAERAALPVLKAEIAPDKNTAWPRGKPLVAFAGIGYPEKFFKTLDADGGNIVDRIAFSDHHRFTARDADALLERAANLGAQLVTTEKDMARIEGETSLERLKRATMTLPVKMIFSDERSVGKLVAKALE